VEEHHDDDYEVGYAKPPKHSRFKPGQSGNPRGRPRGSKNYSVLLEEELNQTVVINENGRRRKISKRAAIIKHMVNKTLSGDTRMLQIMLEELRQTRAEPEAGFNLQEADYELIRHLKKRLTESPDPNSEE
jgi:hypothetical protein